MRRFILAAILILVIFLSGCAHPTIKDINDNPQKFLGKKVVVSGKVVAPMDLGMMSGFTLKQDKSSIMVSSDEVPEANQEVTVKGTVVKGLFSGRYIFADSVR